MSSNRYGILKIYEEYSREDLNDIFNPELNYHPGAGKWGGSGIVNIQGDDFAFVVTLEEGAGNDYFDALTEDGVLIWKSQNRQNQKSKQIELFKSHNYEENNILLFLRAKGGKKYTYFGPLAFRGCDLQSSNPVHFTWDLLAWPVPIDILTNSGINLLKAVNPNYSLPPVDTKKAKLVKTDPPKPKRKSKTQNSKNNGHRDWAANESRNREVGNAGEELVIEYEKNMLMSENRPDLADKVTHIAKIQSNAGYDVLSFATDGTEKYIEVKTTTSGVNTSFFISSNEVKISESVKEQYWVYRIYDFSFEDHITQFNFYAINGAVSDKFELTPSTFSARPSN